MQASTPSPTIPAANPLGLTTPAPPVFADTLGCALPPVALPVLPLPVTLTVVDGPGSAELPLVLAGTTTLVSAAKARM